ncbi:class I SAM-dependent methyltransferase [Vallitalea okinawensis]|uniref:class I SAM-dependent methyltransferase n=1 Tax=Vallitalea okinawensis TaxID=2078660 RepID=UPI000CFDEA51|nr:class I SAM-dependent methyltransferase [Vallitalea okinawensis]
MSEYWNKRFENGGRVWGDEPSYSAYVAEKLFKKEGIKSVLIPGSGYGRHSNFFYKKGFQVEGVEISKEAIRLATETNDKIHYYHGSILDLDNQKKYDAIYCFNVLHLFFEEQRRLFIEKCESMLNDNGVVFFTGFSDQEESYGKGQEFEKNTFEHKKGKPIHYYTEDDMRKEFKRFDIRDTGLLHEPENHGEGEHVHILRYIYAAKMSY